MAPAETRLQHLQRTADNLLKGEPLFFEVKPAGLNARHVQQVVHQARGIQHVLANFAGLHRVL